MNSQGVRLGIFLCFDTRKAILITSQIGLGSDFVVDIANITADDHLVLSAFVDNTHDAWCMF